MLRGLTDMGFCDADLACRQVFLRATVSVLVGGTNPKMSLQAKAASRENNSRLQCFAAYSQEESFIFHDNGIHINLEPSLRGRALF